MQIRVIEYDSPEYKKSVELREKILRHPLGQKFKPEYLEMDKGDWHIAAFDGEQIIGTVILKPLNDKTIKIRQVAVDTLRQGQGIGRELMIFAEKFAKEKGFKHAVLHARFYTIAFYKKLGYKITSDAFEEVGMEHYKMEKEL